MNKQTEPPTVPPRLCSCPAVDEGLPDEKGLFHDRGCRQFSLEDTWLGLMDENPATATERFFRHYA